MKKGILAASMAVWVGCSTTSGQSTARDALDAKNGEGASAELATLHAESEEQAEELRAMRSQLALARAEVEDLKESDPVVRPRQVIRIPDRSGDEDAWGGSGGDAGDDQARPVLRLQGNEPVEVLSTTQGVPPIPLVMEDRSLRETAVQHYRRGLGLVQAQQFAEALAVFADFLASYPQHPYTDNALFWCGEIRYVTGDYSPALQDFEQIVERFPYGNKLPDALYKIGLIHLKRGDRSRARAYFKRVREQFPDTAAARMASREDAT